MTNGDVNGTIFDIKRYAIHDGPGIRTTVFLKGCPLRCEWCQNPESQETSPQLSLIPDRCIRCGACLEVCPNVDDPHGGDPLVTDRIQCNRCGACVEACPSTARAMLGRRLTVNQLMGEIDKDRLFYDESKGGVTFSGGEPLQQASFLAAALEACRNQGYHTAVDTCGYAPREALREIGEYTDLFLYDLKIMDDARHRELLGVSNALILENLRDLCERRIPTWIRLPLIPGVNDDNRDLTALADFVHTLPGSCPVQVLPYHRIGSEKHSRLGIPYGMANTVPPSDEQTARAAMRLSEAGLDVRIGG